MKELISTFIIAVLPIYIASFTLYMVRALRGPTVPDTVLAIDAMTFDLAAFLVILAIFFESPILVATAIVLALWIYSLDIYVAKYLEAREMGE
ncbi:MAG: monovalent cation/H+ antiporter complex subunit F [Sulfolobales archaeon]|nr:monovalent cation/H+ antiporter complex subunit F [Sulfolobales archaeon]MCX8198860.1 monovalent cation/H+ antiporter complex subunit F [Sulfolobales archaeon]MDW8170742.1 monovalent cation/H+ antiporter complex subunit F [Desulfurococcaceae archaeon]